MFWLVVSKSPFSVNFKGNCTGKESSCIFLLWFVINLEIFFWYKWNQNISFPYIFSHCVGLLTAWLTSLKLLQTSDLTTNSERTDLLYLWDWVSHHLQTVAQSHQVLNDRLAWAAGRDRHLLSLYPCDTFLGPAYLPRLTLSSLCPRQRKCGTIHRSVKIVLLMKGWCYVIRTWNKWTFNDFCISSPGPP